MKNKQISCGSRIGTTKKILISMKILFILSFVGVLQMHAINIYSQSTTLSIKNSNTAKSSPLIDLFKQIEEQSEFLFNYKNSDIKDVTYDNSVTGGSIYEVLDKALIGSNLSYSVKDRHVTITRSVVKNNPPNNGVTITGTVIDNLAEPLISVSVVEKGTLNGTVTDVDGKFSLKVADANATLVFTYVGYVTQSIPLKGKHTLNVSLLTDDKLLDEIVVVGYGVQKKVNLTGSISQIGSKELLKAPMQNVSNLLTGKISGLTSIQSSGKPGEDGAALYVRGINGFEANGPLVIVDGIPRPIDYVNPNDVESISVLKDAAAAVYGVRGAGGVILITTKSGEQGQNKINYDGSVTFTENTAMPEFLNGADYMYWHNKAKMMDGKEPLWTSDIQNKVLNNDPNSIWGQTDWLDKVFRTGLTHQHNISASGGTEKARYFTSLGIMDQEGTLKNTSYTRYNVRGNIEVKVAKNLIFTANLSGYRTDRDWPGTAIGNQQEYDPIRQAISTIPIIKSEYQGLPTGWKGTSYYTNGEAALNESGFKRQSRWKFESNFKLEYDLSDLTDVLKGLKLSLSGAYDYGHTTDSEYDSYYQLYTINDSFDEAILGASGFTPGGGYTKSSSWGDDYQLRPQLNYLRDFGKNSLGVLFLYEKQRGYANTMTGTKKQYYSDYPVDLSLGTEFPERPVTGSHGYTGIESYVGRVNYSYDRKYLAEFTFRRDGSYRFAPENRWGFFPSASAGWVISEENFFKEALPKVDFLKLRASYGQIGKDNLDPFLYNSTFELASNSMVLGGQPITQFYSKNAYVYRDLKWSKTNSYNLGIDFEMWQGKLGFELDVFYQLTSNILERQGGMYPSSLGGYYPSYSNSGKVDNRGFEITLKHNNRVNSDWSYGLRGNFSFARNKVLAKAVADNYPNYRAQLGQPMGARYGYKALGLFQTQEEIDNYPAAPSGYIKPGDIKYLDVNGDGRINADQDYVKIGYGAIPEINFSLNMDVSYKDFYASMLWQGVTHCDYELSGVYGTGVTASTVYTSAFAGNGNTPYYLVENAWTPENTNARYPRLSAEANGNNAWRSSWWVVNGEYLRLKNAQIGYNLPAKILSKTPFARVNFYLSGTNLLTMSHFKYVDPESPSVSNGYYPQQRTYSLGLNVTF